ncbi:MAG: Txe/YoeB family addiction module toxin [Prevotella sp.]|nr:Txe/YoeB family addiction module toxin [Prevotella sp.]
MNCYFVDITEKAQLDLNRLAKDEPKAYKKALKLIAELYEHPTTGTGHPEQLKGIPNNRWSRHINDKHRLVYRVLAEEVIVLVISAYGHYDDK